jgi:hypothetical protein
MREFFKGWRRKAGCVALVMAVALAGIWVRGLVAPKSVKIQVGHRIHWLTTIDGRLIWESADKVHGMGLLEEESSLTALPNKRRRIINLRTTILPMTLLSAYLILWKPRTKPAD